MVAALTLEHAGGITAAAAVFGGVVGYTAGAILEQFPLFRGRDLPGRLERQGVRWGGYAAAIYFFYKWQGVA